MRHIVSAMIGVWLASAIAVQAKDGTSEPVVVIELYTSQGCSSCPVADDYLGRLAEDDRLMPLALHVDYWDYIGWADSFGDPSFTVRQRAYARAAGSRTIYTPQMIVGGQDRVEGNQPEKVDRAIERHLGGAAAVDLTVRRDGDTLLITAHALRRFEAPLRVQLVQYRPAQTVEITRGENAGRTITYRNIVTSWQTLGEWSGGEPLALQAKARGPDPVVVILQAGGPADIIAAARLK